MKVICHGIPKEFLDRYDRKNLAAECHLTADTIAQDIRSIYE